MKDLGPGGGAIASNPHDAIVSITPPRVADVEPAALKQSRRIRTSDSDSSNKVWVADQFTDAELGFELLYSLSKEA